mgnify:CR=1 FL=1
MPSCETKLELSRTRAAFYRKVVQRYRDAIAAGEEKTVPELKGLILPADAAVQKSKEEIIEGIGRGEFEFDRDFTSFAAAAVSFCHSLAPIESELGVPFWLSPAEIMDIRAADEFDRALLLCSLLRSTGCRSARVRVLQLEGGAEHPLVAFDCAGSRTYADPSQWDKARQLGDPADEALKEFSYEGKKFVASKYEFDDEQYAEF